MGYMGYILMVSKAGDDLILVSGGRFLYTYRTALDRIYSLSAMRTSTA